MTVITKARYVAIVQTLHQMLEKKMQDVKNSHKQYSLGRKVKVNKLLSLKMAEGKPTEILKKSFYSLHFCLMRFMRHI
jgi:S-adenosylhomocysteine hydrolase